MIEEILRAYEEGLIDYTEAMFQLLEQGVLKPAELLQKRFPNIPK